MAPWLHELLGFPNHGRPFELVVWSLTLALGAALLWRERRSGRTVRENLLAWALGLGLVTLGSVRLILAASGRLAFGEAGLHVPTYGVAMALGFGVPLALGVRDARRHPGPLSPDQAIDLTFWVIVSGLAGARVLALVADLPSTVGACLAGGPEAARACVGIVAFWQGGLVFYGGVIGALLGGWLWCRRSGVPFLPAADQFVPFLALGHAIGRLGCVAAGCCFGAECPADYVLGLQYPAGSPAWEAQAQHYGGATAAMVQSGSALPVHPTQLYEVAVELVLFAALLRWRRRGAATGRVVGTWLVAYGAARFLLELTRGDALRGYLVRVAMPAVAQLLGTPRDAPMLLTTSQVVALAAVAFGAVVLRQARSRAR